MIDGMGSRLKGNAYHSEVESSEYISKVQKVSPKK